MSSGPQGSHNNPGANAQPLPSQTSILRGLDYFRTRSLSRSPQPTGQDPVASSPAPSATPTPEPAAARSRHFRTRARASRRAGTTGNQITTIVLPSPLEQDAPQTQTGSPVPGTDRSPDIHQGPEPVQSAMMTRQRPTTFATSVDAAAVGEDAANVALVRGLVARNNTAAAIAAARNANPPLSTGTQRAPLVLNRLPTIQFVAEHDAHSNRPSLQFNPISRTLPSANSVIRVGRFSERDCPDNIQPNVPSDAPVGFRSKVVSRKHCIFFYTEGQWWIKDVKSSSGTFLNHIRLSPPNNESKPFPIKDGDVLQLGIDFKGGEEMIYRCVKVLIQCNRGWQKGLNSYNKNAHKALQDLARAQAGSDVDSKQSTECTICLNSIAPCQPLFVAPCSHTWHYKCIRPLIENPKHPHFQYPLFLCPNCRAVADLEAEIEEPLAWDETDPEEDELGEHGESSSRQATELRRPSDPEEEDGEALLLQPTEDSLVADLGAMTFADPRQLPLVDIMPDTPGHDETLHDMTAILTPQPSSSARAARNRSVRVGAPPPSAARRQARVRSKSTSSSSGPSFSPLSENELPSSSSSQDALHSAARPAGGAEPVQISPQSVSFAPESLGDTGPATPRNVAGPFVFDGSGNNSPRSSRDGAPGSGGRARQGQARGSGSGSGDALRDPSGQLWR